MIVGICVRASRRRRSTEGSVPCGWSALDLYGSSDVRRPGDPLASPLVRWFQATPIQFRDAVTMHADGEPVS
jgi:hypothetical protein